MKFGWGNVSGYFAEQNAHSRRIAILIQWYVSETNKKIPIRKIRLCFRKLMLASRGVDAFIFSLYISVLVAFASIFRKNATMWVSNVVVSILATIGLSANLIADGTENAANKPVSWIGITLFAMAFVDIYYASYATNCDVKTAVEKLFRRKK